MMSSRQLRRLAVNGVRVAAAGLAIGGVAGAAGCGGVKTVTRTVTVSTPSATQPIAKPSAPAKPVLSHPSKKPPKPHRRNYSWLHMHRQELKSPSIGLDTGVTWYMDCSGQKPLTDVSAAIDTCVGHSKYFVGHNPGVFAPMMNAHVGTVIYYEDGGGTIHRYKVVHVQPNFHKGGYPPLGKRGVTAQFQACDPNSGGKIDRILGAIET